MIGERPHDIISFKSIKNIGKGHAHNISLKSFPVKTKELAVASSTKRFPILASGDTMDVDSPISIYWKNVEPDEKGHRFLEIKVRISCVDEQDKFI